MNEQPRHGWGSENLLGRFGAPYFLEPKHVSSLNCTTVYDNMRTGLHISTLLLAGGRLITRTATIQCGSRSLDQGLTNLEDSSGLYSCFEVTQIRNGSLCPSFGLRVLTLSAHQTCSACLVCVLPSNDSSPHVPVTTDNEFECGVPFPGLLY